MTFDLGKAMRRKEEHESARLEDFAFRRRVRATRLLAERLDLDPLLVPAWVAGHGEASLIDRLATLSSHRADTVAQLYQDCLASAYRELVAERGDPTPHRLA